MVAKVAIVNVVIFVLVFQVVAIAILTAVDGGVITVDSLLSFVVCQLILIINLSKHDDLKFKYIIFKLSSLFLFRIRKQLFSVSVAYS